MPAAGTTLGPYKIVGPLGFKGMGEVWQAFDLKLRVEVALKFLLPELASDPHLIEMLHREVRAALDVFSPHVNRATTRPKAFMLLPSAPNPMTNTATISFDLPRAAPVALRLYDIRGRLVRTMLDGQEFAAGRHGVTWDGFGQGAQRLSPGVYWVRMTSTRFRSVRRLVLTR